MSKRFAIVFFVVIGICIFAVAGFCLTLFLAPGLRVLGLKYIRSDLHAVATGKYAISDTKAFEGLDDVFKGNIIVETSEVPINIIYSQDQEYYFEYYDNFSGFTTSKFADPTLTVTKDEQGNCVIKIKEFKKFIYESSSSKRYLNIYVPLQFTSNYESYSKNLSVKTKTATITFSREIADDLRVPSHHTLSIETKNGKVKYDDVNIHTTNFVYTTNNSIKLKCHTDKDVFSQNYTVESRLGRIVFNGPVSGNIKAKTKNGNVELVSCKNLVVETEFGDVKSSGKEAISTTGIVRITTKAGEVRLGDVNGAGENQITTGGGSVTINKIKTATITTKRGSISIKSVKDAVISTNVGKVTVEEALGSINVTTKRGNITLGGAGIKMNNATVATTMGKVKMLSASGKVDIRTTKSNVTFANMDSENITIVSGKKLTATGLTGVCAITTNGETNLTFSKITDTTTVTLLEKCKYIKIDATNNTDNETKFYFEGKSVVRYEDEAPVGPASSKLQNDKNVNVQAYIKVIGENAEIHAYFKKP